MRLFQFLIITCAMIFGLFNCSQEPTSTPIPQSPAGAAVLEYGITYNMLQWSQAPSDDCDYYNVYWSTTAGTGISGNKISNISSTAYLHKGLLPKTTYYYIITAVNSTGESEPSEEFCATTDSLPVPIISINITDIEDHSIHFSLGREIRRTKIYDNDTIFLKLYRSVSTGIGKSGNEIVVNDTNCYTDTGLESHFSYFYSALYFVDSVDGALSEECTLKTTIKIDEVLFSNSVFDSIVTAKAAMLGQTYANCIYEITTTDSNVGGFGGIQYLDNLVELKLYNGGNISSLGPLGWLPKLERLQLDACNIDTLIAIDRCTKLTYLSLSGNNISNIDILKSLLDIEYLNLYGNSITNIDSLKYCIKIKELNIAGNNITDVSAIANLTALTNLYMGENPIAVGVGNLFSLVNLSTLSLSGSPSIPCSDMQLLINALTSTAITPSATIPGSNCAQ